MGGAFDHASARTARTDAAAFARERNQALLAAVTATQTHEAVREDATAQVASKLLFHEAADAALVAALLHLGEEGLEVVVNDGVQIHGHGTCVRTDCPLRGQNQDPCCE